MDIDVSGVSKSFSGHPVLHDVSLHVEDRSLTALLGPSGSGKSTLLRIIAGLEIPGEGSIRIGERDVTKVPPKARDIGFVFQHYAAFRHMTVFENVAFGMRIRKQPRKVIRERVHELLNLVQLDGFAERYPAQLSGGQRQRMALARSLAIEPTVLLLDEPFGALDAQVRRDLRRWLRTLHDKMPVTTVIVTHDQEEAMDIADTVVIMNDGRIEQVGSPRDVYEYPASEFVMSFLGPVTDMDGSLVRPHDLAITDSPEDGAAEAMVERIVHLGFETRVELMRADGWRMWAQLTSDDAEQRELHVGQIVWVRSRRARTFEGLSAAAGVAIDGAPDLPAGS